MTSFSRRTIGLVSASLLALACTGETGPAGAPGAQGSAGAKGTDGVSGVDGQDGKNGTNGANGTSGTNGKDGAVGPAGDAGPQGPGTSSLSFVDVGFARTNADKHVVRASTKANVNGTDITIGFQNIVRSNQDPSKADKKCDAASPTTCVGTLVDKNGVVMKDDSGVAVPPSNYNDFTSLLESGGNKFLVHQFEETPSALYVTKLTQDSTTGALTATSSKSVNLASIDGMYRTCAGSITPWGSHITAEEAQVNARAVESATTWAALKGSSRFGETKQMARYLGVNVPADVNGTDADAAAFHAAYSAYFHGYAVETSLDANGTPTVKKHYAMGRLGMELAYVMPDKKTVFLTDDVTNGGLHMFVADTAGDLSAGNLYAMRVYQKTAPGGAFLADIEWIPLGHATDAEISALLHPTGGAQRIKFADMFETSDVQTGNTCLEGFTLVRANGDNTNLECLKVKPNMDKAASRLESRRYSVIKGATAELTKEEGLTYDPDTNRIYIALSDIASSMGPQTGGDDHINVALNSCGAVMALDVGPAFEPGGAKITDYAALNWYPLVSGTPMTYTTGEYVGNTCSVSGLASPDNVTYLPGYQTLIIGEDTGSGHQNDALWAYHVPSGKLTRILTTPYGSEVTSPYWVPSFGGHGYLITVVQHPYGESDQGKLTDTGNTGRDSWAGVIGPFPKLN